MEYRNPKYCASGDIDCEINHPKFGWIPFTASPNDTEEHGKAIYAAIIADRDEGKTTVDDYEPPSEEELAAMIRAERDTLLYQSDWTQLPDVPLVTKQVWATYRQDLRDVPQQEGFPTNFVWPTPPNQSHQTPQF